MRRFKEITVKYPGKCNCCGGLINRGEAAVWDSEKKTITHAEVRGDISPKCFANLKRKQEQGPDPTDIAYEDQCAAACGPGL